LKNQVGHEIRGEITVIKLAEGDDFWFELLPASKFKGSRNLVKGSVFFRPTLQQQLIVVQDLIV